MRSIRFAGVAALAITLAPAACATRSPEQQIVADAAAALGGSERILAVKTVTIEGDGTNGNLGQDMTMDASGETFEITAYRRVIDPSGGRSYTEQTRTPRFAYFQGPQPQAQVFGVADGIAYSISTDGRATRASNAVAKDRTAEIYHHPIAIVRAALDPGAKLANARDAAGERAVEIETKDGLRFTLAIDGTTKLPTRVVSMAANASLGDVAMETGFADYQEISGLKLPTRFVTRTETFETSTLRVVRQAIDAFSGDLNAPQAASSAAAVTGPPAPNVTVEEVAKGVWFLAGQSHNSVVVEFADHLMLIEAPQNEGRTLAVIAKARELASGKPLTQVVNTHHHFDHSAGIRAAVAEGLAVITHKTNATFLRDATLRPHTIAPDALAKNPKVATIVPVDGEMRLEDDSTTVVLYPIEGSPHGDAMLMAYLPRARVLVEADAFSPGSAVQPYAANLLENIRKRRLTVDRIVPLHGAIAPFNELAKVTP